MFRCRKLSCFSTVSIIILVFHKTRCQDFAYDGPHGPRHWGEQYNKCDGKYQSPINIDSKLVKYVQLPPLVIEGFNTLPASALVKNNGHTAQVLMDFKERATIKGGPLDGTYEFVQFHFHWGDHDDYGSESLINSRSYPVELHMVFYKTDYETFSNALTYPDGVTVIACLFEVAKVPNPSFEELTILINDIIKPDKETTFLNPPKLIEFLPRDLVHYYTYNGSLTTPPCSEAVTWIDFSTPIPISSSQIASFRRIRDHHGDLLKHNSRPIQPLNGRIVLYNVEELEFKPIVSEDGEFEHNDIRYDIVKEQQDKPDSANNIFNANKIITFLCILLSILNIIKT